MSAKVLTPLCRFNLAQHFQDYVEVADRARSEKGLVSLAWGSLHAAGFKQFVCFFRGVGGREEIVVVLAEGVTSWPVRQLIPDAVAFLEVQAL